MFWVRVFVGCLLVLAFDAPSGFQTNEFLAPSPHLFFQRRGDHEVVVSNETVSEGYFNIDPCFETKDRTVPEHYGTKLFIPEGENSKWIPLSNNEIHLPLATKTRLVLMTFSWNSFGNFPILPGDIIRTITFHEKNHGCMIAPTSRNFVNNINQTTREIPAFDQQTFWIHCRSIYTKIPILSVSGETDGGFVSFYV